MVGVNETVCVIDSSLPPYQPNIYICKNNTLCCALNGKIKCCANDLSLNEFIDQAWPIVALFASFLLIAYVISWIFSEPESEPEKTIDEKDFNNTWNPQLSYETIVEDPLFGMQYEYNLQRLKDEGNKQSQFNDVARKRK